MADTKKDAKDASAKSVDKNVPASALRDLDMLDAKIENVKGGGTRKLPRG